MISLPPTTIDRAAMDYLNQYYLDPAVKLLCRAPIGISMMFISLSPNMSAKLLSYLPGVGGLTTF